MELTSSFVDLLQHFAPVFTAPTYQTFLVIVAGWVLSQRHRFITEVIFSGGHVGKGHWARFHRFFSHAAWDIDSFSMALAKMVVTILAPGAQLLWAVDDTLCRKRGLTLYGAGMHHDPLISSRSKALVSWGHDWVVLCLIVVHPFWAPTKVFALPIAARLYINRQGLTKGKKSKGKAARTRKVKGQAKRVSDNRERLASLLDEVAVHEGVHRTLVEGVEVARVSNPVPRAPVVYEPKILIVGQGRKRAYLAGEVYTYDAYNYLVLSVPLPAECETEASPEEPLLLLAINVDPTMLGEMLLEMDESPSPVGPTPRGISTTPMTVELGGAVIRLLECLKSPLDGRVLGRQTVREILYRVLQGQQGGALRALASRDEHLSRIARVLRHVHAEYAKPLSVEGLARKAGMSVAAFHHYFKLVTASSPLQYLKRIRLDQARRLMAHDGYNASTAARAVGYESASQFSREFKRLFGVTPVEEAEQTRARLVAG